MKPFRLALAAVVVLFAISSAFPDLLAQSRALKSSRQDAFNAEDELKHQIKIPRYVIEQILPVDQVDSGNSVLNRLQGVLIDLESNGRPGLLVMGPLGANVTTFSIFRNVRGKYKLVIQVPTLALDLNNSYTNGLRDIELASATADTLSESTVKFDGKKYRAVKCWWQTIGAKRKHYVKCNQDN